MTDHTPAEAAAGCGRSGSRTPTAGPSAGSRRAVSQQGFCSMCTCCGMHAGTHDR
jgi:hypothetical protein